MKQQDVQLSFKAAMDKRCPEWKMEFSTNRIIQLSCLFYDGIIHGMETAGENLEKLKYSTTKEIEEKQNECN